MSRLSLFLFGTFEAALDGEPVASFGSDKARALLAFLVVESAHPHRRERVAGMFWPDSPERQSAHNLSQTLLRLRQALRESKTSAPDGHEPFLLVTPRDLQVDPHSDHECDVVRFRQLLRASQLHHHPGADAGTCTVCAGWLRQAAGLYRGELLAGLSPAGSCGFEAWQIAQREALQRQAVEILLRLAAHHEACGENELVLRYAERLVAIEPWNEQGSLHLMRALARAGQTTTALDRYKSYCRVLAEELDVGPSAEAIALCERLRSGRVRKSDDGGPAPVPAGGASPADRASRRVRADRADLASGESRGDRRQVTALICGQPDPAGGGADPEDIQRRLALCNPACRTILERFGGRRQQCHGDECLVYFGYPQAYEDAARRAVHAGLAMVARAGGAGGVRVGIHTGDMLVSRGAGANRAGLGTIGSVPAVARGCQAAAQPGTVQITAGTERLVRGWFHCRELGRRKLPGLAEPVETYQVLAESDARNRLDCVSQACELTSFVGRAPELDLLLRCHDEMRDGSGRAVLVTGEPGIGKSRLLREGRARWSAESGGEETWLEVHCCAYEQHTSLLPIIGLLGQLLGFEAGDSPETRRGKLDATLARCDLDRPAARWLLSLLLALPTDRPAPQMISADQHERMREWVILLLQRQATRRPLVVAIEDLHWSDTATVEWLGLSLDALTAVPCLLLFTCRPTNVPPWPSCESLIPLVLEPLTTSQTEDLVASVAGGRPLPDEVRRRIVSQADGIPLFAEELTTTVLDRQVSMPSEPSKALRIPATLRDSLMARLDHAGAAIQTAQWLAVLGRESTYSILRAVVPHDDQHLRDDLSALLDANLITARGRTSSGHSGSAFDFKHALIQETAYASLPAERRQSLHRRVAEVLELRFPQVAEKHPELLAQHYSHSGLRLQAVDFWLRAGERALVQGATSDAGTFFESALGRITPDDAERRWRALLGRERTHDLRGERDAQQADLSALMELAEALDDDLRRAEIYMRRAVHAAVQGRFGEAIPFAEGAGAAARRAGNLALETHALVVKAQALTFSADAETAHQAVEQVLARIEEITDDSVRAQALAVAARHYRESGDLVRSAELQRRSVESARRAGHLKLELSTSANLGLLYATLGSYAQARTTLEAGLTGADAVGDRRLHASLRYSLGYVHWLNGNAQLGQQMVEGALPELAEVGDTYAEAVCLAFLGYILESTGDLPRAAHHLAQARAIFTKMGMEADRFEAQAVEARVALARRRRKQARRLAIEVWSYLREFGAEGIDSPSRVYLCVADVLAAVEPDAVSPTASSSDVLSAGYQDLMRRAELVTDAELRRSFLENVAENKELVARWDRSRRPDQR